MIRQSLGDKDHARDYLRRALNTNPYCSPSGVALARTTLAEIEQHLGVQGAFHVP